MLVNCPQWFHPLVWGLVIIKEARVLNDCCESWSEVSLSASLLPSLIETREHISVYSSREDTVS